jgi:nitrogen regulatory protein P-II 1
LSADNKNQKRFLMQYFIYSCLIKIDVVVPENYLEAISEGLKKINVGGVTILKVKGRGKTVAPRIHASKGTEMFTPEFSDKYTLQVILPDEKQNEAIEIIRANSKMGKIFVSPIIRAVDIESGSEDEKAI